MKKYDVQVKEWKNKQFINPKEYTCSLAEARKGLTGVKELDESIVDSIVVMAQDDCCGIHYSKIVGSYQKRNKVEYSVGISV
jgi:hypothetical protein